MTPLVALVYILGCLTLSDAADNPFEFDCLYPIDDAAPPVVNASVYSYKVTISVAGKNETVEAYENYDINQGTIQMVVHYPNAMNASEWKTDWIKYDYNFNQTLTVDMDTKECNVNDLMHNETISIFGVGIEDGFKNVKYPFYWNGNYSYTMENDTFVHGVRANVYSTCLLFNENKTKYDVELYFSSEEWQTRSGSEIPLMLVLKANSTEDGSSFTYDEYTYLFTSYRHDSQSGWNPESNNPLFDVRCDGRKDVLPLPMTWSSYAMTQEIVDPENKMILSVNKFYDYKKKLAKADYIAPKHSPYGRLPAPNHHFTFIQDFLGGIQYRIDRETGSCVIGDLQRDSMILFDVEDDPGHPGYLMMMDQHQFVEDRNFTYTGRHKLRHRTVDSWTTTVPALRNGTRGNVSYEVEVSETLIYTTPDWSNGEMSPVLLNLISRMKIKANGTTSKRSFMVHVSGFSNSSHGHHQFDVDQCYRDDKAYKFVMKFDKSYGKYAKEHPEVMSAAIREQISKVALVPDIRVSSWIDMELADDNGNPNLDKSLFVTASIFGLPMSHAETKEYNPGVNLTTAVDNLRNVIDSNKFQVDFELHNGEKVQMTAFSDYFHEKGALYSPKGPPPPPTPAPANMGLSKGAMAAIGLSMVLVGLALGALCMHIRYKRGNRQFGYSMQD